jgi:hypothetical protein
MGSCYMDELATHIDPTELPSSIGGDHTGNSTEQQGKPFSFDTVEGGALWMARDHF